MLIDKDGIVKKVTVSAMGRQIACSEMNLSLLQLCVSRSVLMVTE